MRWGTDIDARRQRFDQASCPSFRLVSYYAFGKILFFIAEGSTSRYSYCFLSEKWAATQTVRCESESRSEEIEGPANAGFRPRTLALAERCISKT